MVTKNILLNRRRFLRLGAGGLALGLAKPASIFANKPSSPKRLQGVVIGELTAAKVGQRIFEEGGNAVDAVVAAAMTACVVSPQNCGFGGYGGHGILFLARSRKLVCVDFNSIAPAAAHEKMFIKTVEPGSARENFFGWLAAGVPGTAAGLEHLSRFGTKPLRELLQPAIEFAANGFPVTQGIAGSTRGGENQIRKVPALAHILLPDGKIPVAGEMMTNPDLARLLKRFQADNSFDQFYRGEIARQIADAFQRNGGLVQLSDLKIYRSREVKPFKFQQGDFEIQTAPVTAGGITALETLAILKAAGLQRDPLKELHGRIEALRLSWRDRLTLLGDVERKIAAKLLDSGYARKLGGQVVRAVEKRQPIPIELDSIPFDGTVHLSAADEEGNLAAVTLTHGSLFGARVAVDGLGLILGHGMSRFNPLPGHPNSPGPHKRPLHNMCPTILLRKGKAVMAVGAGGGRKIPNAVFNILRESLDGQSMPDAVASPRIHTEGNLELVMEKKWDPAAVEQMKSIGYKVTAGQVAVASAASWNPITRETAGLTR